MSTNLRYADPTTQAATVPCYNTVRGSYYIVNVYSWVKPFTDAQGRTFGNGYRFDGIMREAIQSSLRKADYILDSSAGQWDQHFRYLCDSSNKPVIETVMVNPCQDQLCGHLSSVDVRAAGFEAGHTNRNYIYFYWLDSDILEPPGNSCYGGNGECPDQNNVSPSYAVRMPYQPGGIDGTRFAGRTFVHETMHALDALQPQTIHGTNAGHCADAFHSAHSSDEIHYHHDVMCHNDGGSTYFARRIETCVTEPAWWVDCNKDDYWKPNGGNFMADINGSLTVWNTAKSIWLSSLCSEATQEEPLACQRTDGRVN